MKKLGGFPCFFISLGLIAAAGFVEYLMGRVLICKCAYVKVWHGSIFSSENSQHLSDWYSFSHIIHGFAFFYIARWLFPRRSLGFWLVLSTAVEAGWEILENTPLIINRYREGTISLDYYGDSVINSLSDILFMVLGFYLAAKLPLKSIIFLTVLMEIAVGFLIRDNLTLNIIMLIYPLEFLRKFQMGS